MWTEARYRLTGTAPLIMHSGRLADPRDKFTKLSKPISAKTKKTDADHDELARLAFFGGLYMGESGPVVPAPNVDAAILAAAKKERQGPLVKSGLFAAEDAILEYDGPRTADELWEDGRFTHTALARVQSARVIRTRPMFKEWSCVITIQYESTLVNREQIDHWLNIAGMQCGLGDWRPQYGRFSVEAL